VFCPKPRTKIRGGCRQLSEKPKKHLRVETKPPRGGCVAVFLESWLERALKLPLTEKNSRVYPDLNSVLSSSSADPAVPKAAAGVECAAQGAHSAAPPRQTPGPFPFWFLSASRTAASRRSARASQGAVGEKRRPEEDRGERGGVSGYVFGM